jgi:PAS domain-containing protein
MTDNCSLNKDQAMKMKPSTPPDAAKLRRQAEAKLSERKKKAAAPPATESDTKRLIYELEVHQIELEMQNEELAHSRADVEALLRQYADLYDFAPVGYFTLARDGAIVQVNLTGANLLGVERSALIERRFGVFVSAESRTTFNTFLEKAFGSQ